MFTLFNPSKTFPKVQNVNLEVIQLYMVKFEEAIKNFDELQKEMVKSR